MFSTFFLCGVVTLLCIVVVNLAAYTHRLFKANRSRRLDLRRFFWAIGFLPVAIVTISNISFGNPVLLNALAFLRNPFLGIDVTIGAFAQIGEISFLMDFLTAILLSSTVVITLAGSATFAERDAALDVKKPCGKKALPAADHQEYRATEHPYLCFGCYLS